jgi:thiol-disulfide isomerase/thioredoxin
MLENLQIGGKMPDVSATDLDGKVVKLSDYKNKVIVLDIWATWCGPCRAMIPHEREMVKRFKDKPFALISVCANDTIGELKSFLEKESMPWDQWYTGKAGELLMTLNVDHFPTIYVLDAKGIIRYKEVRGEELDKAVEVLLNEMTSK